MIIENEFTVAAGLDRVWQELLDMEGVATCLPGATITTTDEDNVYEGTMRLKIGPMRVEYRGTATLSDVDEEHHAAVISLSAREAKGQGTAMATIRNRLDPVHGGTRVTAQTDLQITGPQAQFGRGVIEDVGKRVLSEFSRRLEQRIAGPEPGATSPASDPDAQTAAVAGSETSEAQAPAPAELDVGALITTSPAVRRVAGVALALGLIVLALVLLRRRR